MGAPDPGTMLPHPSWNEDKLTALLAKNLLLSEEMGHSLADISKARWPSKGELDKYGEQLKYTQTILDKMKVTPQQQVQSEIEETKQKLKELEEKLENLQKSTDIRTASPGSTLQDGCGVAARDEKSVLIVAPKETEVVCRWTPGFDDVFIKFLEYGFIPSQWHIPTCREMSIAADALCYSNFFDGETYWCSDKIDKDLSNAFQLKTRQGLIKNRFSEFHVRAFRQVYL